MIDWYLGQRVRKGKEDPDRLEERRGRASLDRPEGIVAWVHGASVGESLSILPLLEAMIARWPTLSILVTTGTVTSARLMEERLTHPRMFHQFVPIDVPIYVDHFLAHWRPDIALWVESEFWPNLMSRTAAAGTPMILVNARLSDRSFKGWQRARGAIHKLLVQFRLCLAQDEQTAERLRGLGAPNVRVTGNLKSIAPPLPHDEAAFGALKESIGERECWVAASTHPGEEERIAEAHRSLRKQIPAILTILVPRHPERGSEIAESLRAKGFEISLRSSSEHVENKTEIYVADTLGELGVFYRLARVAFLGGSLVPHGGQNALEAIRLSCAVVHGPHTHNFVDLYGQLNESGGSTQIENAEELSRCVLDLLGDPSRVEAQVARAKEILATEGDVVGQTIDQIDPYMPDVSSIHHTPFHARA